MEKILNNLIACCLLFSPLMAQAQTRIDLPRIEKLAAKYAPDHHPALKALYLGALKNIDSQFIAEKDGTVYVSTGDIPAEWLRDSSVETRPFLLFAKSDPTTAQFIKAVVQRQAKYLIVDPYANAFKEDYTLHEEKFELDSLCNPILLMAAYWEVTGDASIFTPEVHQAFDQVLKTMAIEQHHQTLSKYDRKDLSHHPVGDTGMIWSGFRPSDDACDLNYLIPAEAMAVKALIAIAHIESSIYSDAHAAKKASQMASEVWSGIMKYGIVKSAEGHDIFAYEVDGLGHSKIMDDANLPNLMSLPYFGFISEEDPLYKNTREVIKSKENPYFYQGKLASGLGSLHINRHWVPLPYVWPLGILSDAFTTHSMTEINSDLAMLVNSDTGNHGLHESFDPNQPTTFTRANFGWPNAMLIELWLTRFSKFPELPTNLMDH